MSLLLEALKRATEEKQRNEQSNSSSPRQIEKEPIHNDIDLGEYHEDEHESINDNNNKVNNKNINDETDYEQLVLESESSTQEDLDSDFIELDLDNDEQLKQQVSSEIETEDSISNNRAVDSNDNNDFDEFEDMIAPPPPPIETETSTQAVIEEEVVKKENAHKLSSNDSYIEYKQDSEANEQATISEEEKIERSRKAVSQLIAQQNKQFKLKRFMIISLVILFSLAFVMFSGYYFYSDAINQFVDLNATENISTHSSGVRNTTQISESSNDGSVAEKTANRQNSSAIDEEPSMTGELEITNISSLTESAEAEIKKEQSIASQTTADDTIESLALKSDTIPDDAQTDIKATLPKEEVNDMELINAPSDTANTDELPKVLKISKRYITDQTLNLTQSAYNAYKKGSYQKAQQLYKKVLKNKENYPDALLGLAAIELKRDNVGRAKYYYQQILTNYPGHPYASMALNRLNQTLMPLQTEQQLKAQLQSDIQNANLNESLGNFYASQQRWKQAQKYYFNAYSLDRKNAYYCYNLAISLDNLDKSQQALTYYNKSLSLAMSEQTNSNYPFDVVKTRIKELLESSRLSTGN